MKLKIVEKRNKEIKKQLDKAFKELKTLTVNVEANKPKLRGSSLPFCGIKYIFETLDWEIDNTGELDLFADTYMSIGTVFHELIQRWLGIKGILWGNWYCSNNRCSHFKKNGKPYGKTGHFDYCKYCGNPLSYHEIEINYRGFSGHIDGVIKEEDSYHILEFKTTSKNQMKVMKKPKMFHYLQASSYAYILKKQFDLPVKSFSILYFSREDLINANFKPKVFSYTYDKETGSYIKKAIKQVNLTKKLLKDIKQSKFDKLDKIVSDIRLCENYDEYTHNFSEPYQSCPYSSICFSVVNEMIQAKADEYKDGKKGVRQ